MRSARLSTDFAWLDVTCSGEIFSKMSWNAIKDNREGAGVLGTAALKTVTKMGVSGVRLCTFCHQNHRSARIRGWAILAMQGIWKPVSESALKCKCDILSLEYCCSLFWIRNIFGDGFAAKLICYNVETHPPKAFIVESKKEVAGSNSSVASHASAGLQLPDLYDDHHDGDGDHGDGDDGDDNDGDYDWRWW